MNEKLKNLNKKLEFLKKIIKKKLINKKSN